MSKYTTFSHKKDYEIMIDDCIELFKDNYPELNEVEISKNKILFEMIKFYLKGTKYYKKHKEVFDR